MSGQLRYLGNEPPNDVWTTFAGMLAVRSIVTGSCRHSETTTPARLLALALAVRLARRLLSCWSISPSLWQPWCTTCLCVPGEDWPNTHSSSSSSMKVDLSETLRSPVSKPKVWLRLCRAAPTTVQTHRSFLVDCVSISKNSSHFKSSKSIPDHILKLCWNKIKCNSGWPLVTGWSLSITFILICILH